MPEIDREKLLDPTGASERGVDTTLAPRLRAAGFTDVEMEAYAFASCEMDPETYVAAVLPGIRSFVPGHEGITEEEAKAWLAEQRRLGERGEFFMSSTQFCFAAAKPQA